MWRDDRTAPTRTGTAACGAPLAWLAIGSDRAVMAAQVQSLARFGVSAELADPVGIPTPIAPVLCDRRHRALVRELLGQNPPRIAPLIVLGVNAAEARAGLILAGADDAVSARIAPCELAARMIATQRTRAAAKGIVMLAGFTFDTGLRQACWQGQTLPLMPREFDLLLVLARHAGLAVSRELLLYTVWRTAFDPGTNSPEVHIFKLRQRLVALRGAVQIETVKRQGYRLVTAPQPRG